MKGETEFMLTTAEVIADWSHAEQDVSIADDARIRFVCGMGKSTVFGWAWGQAWVGTEYTEPGTWHMSHGLRNRATGTQKKRFTAVRRKSLLEPGAEYEENQQWK